MPDEATEVDSFLRVGAVLVLHLDPSDAYGNRCRTFVRGWEKSNYIALDRPKIRGRFAPLRENQPCVVRFVSDGNACAFNASMLAWDDAPKDAHCRISWPQQLRSVPFRKYYRIRVELPCKFAMDGEVYHGEIRDLSMGGCGLCVESAPVQVGAELQLAFTLPDGLSLENVQAVVRAVRPMGKDLFLGCEFGERQEHVQSDIAYSVSTSFQRERGRQGAVAPHFLIIDDHEVHAAVLVREFRERGWEAYAASGTIDGLQRLRSMPPTALLISQEHPDLTGLEIARLVKLTRGFELQPIFLYGEDPGDLQEKAMQTGVSAYFPPPFDAAAIVENVVAATSIRKV